MRYRQTASVGVEGKAGDDDYDAWINDRYCEKAHRKVS